MIRSVDAISKLNDKIFNLFTPIISLLLLLFIFNFPVNSSPIFKECNIELLPFDNQIFDIVACAGGLSYGDNNSVLNEIYRVLKPNGLFICIDSLNDNPLYKFNRYLHYIKGNRTKNTLKRMPNIKLIEDYKHKFGIAKINYSGKLIWILYPLSKIIGYRKTKFLSDFFDDILPNWMSFKFIMEAKKISK